MLFHTRALRENIIQQKQSLHLCYFRRIRIHCASSCSPQIESETSNSEKDLNDAMDRLGTLGREINALKTKRANNSMAAARAEETATMARDKANEAKQVCVCVCNSLHLI